MATLEEYSSDVGLMTREGIVNSRNVSGPAVFTPVEVLLVEDDEADAYLVERALNDNPRVGQIVRAKDGEEALGMIDAGEIKPDLAIIDLSMPRKDGFTLLKDFASRENVSFTSIVLTSSKAGADARRAWMRGADRFFTKPKTLEKLSSILDDVISDL